MMIHDCDGDDGGDDDDGMMVMIAMIEMMMMVVMMMIWVNYNDLTRPHPKWWFMWRIAPPTTSFQVGEIF